MQTIEKVEGTALQIDITTKEMEDQKPEEKKGQGVVELVEL